MLKKNKTLEILKNGGEIMIDSICRRATVYDADGENLGACRYDTAERIERMEGYRTRKTDWFATRFIVAEQPAQAMEEAAPAVEAVEEIPAQVEPLQFVGDFVGMVMRETAQEIQELTLDFCADCIAAGDVAARDPDTGEIIAGSPRAICYAIRQRARLARRYGEAVPTWEPLTDNAARVIRAAQYADNNR